jgi:hypothetical protein
MKIITVLGRALLVGALVGVTACAGSPTGTPSPVPGPSPNGQPVGWQIRLSGVVMDDASVPVPAATITVYPFFSVPEPLPVTAIADTNGRYVVSFLGNTAAAVAAQRDGFERAYVSAGVTVGATEVRADIAMSPVLRITAGESLRVVVPARPACGLEEEYVCRPVRVVAPIAGTVVLRVSAESASTRAGIGLTSIAWPRIPRYPCCGGELRQTVSAGEEIVAAVMIPWTMPTGVVRVETSFQ